MEIRLSGAVEAAVQGSEIDLGPRKSQAVFAALALNPGRPVPLTRMIELVWGDDPPRTAEKTLQAYVTRLRNAGADGIDRVGDAYRLDVEAEAVDLVRFERLLEEGNVAAALDLWQGPPLPGLNGGFGPVASRLNEHYLDAVETDIEERIVAGDGAGLVGRLRELVNANPLREGLWALLMRSLYQADRQAEALRAFADARDHLIDGLGIEPGPSLRELERRILDQDPGLRPIAEPDGAVSAHEGNAFLFTDIENSTELWARHIDEMSTATAVHDELIQSAVEAAGGTVFKHTGDGLLAVFADPSAALQAAVAAQLELGRLAVGGRALAVRMAISSGRADEREGDWFGPPLNLAARLLDAAHGGQVLLGGAAHRGLDNGVGTEVTTVELGLSTLRGLSRPERVHQVLHPSLPRRFPPLRTLVEQDANAVPDFPVQLAYTDAIPLVGRNDHLAVLSDLWTTVRTDNRPAFALLAGEPGVGKTRLAAEFVRRLHADEGAVVIYGRCTESHPAPYRPITESLSAYAAARSDAELRTEMGIHGDLLTAVVPDLVGRFPDLQPPLVDSDSSNLPIFDAVTAFLQVASSSPLVMVLDDIHWADRVSLDLVLHLVRHLASGRLLVVATYRDVEVDRTHPLSRVLADLRRDERVERLAVRGIDDAGAVALTEAVLGHELSDAGRAAAVQAAEDAAGNPFFLKEMLRHFMESGTLVRIQGRWTAVDASALADAVPEGVREVVGRRLDHVSEATNQLLRTASALVDAIDVDLLIALGDGREDEILDLLDEALEAGLLIDGARPDSYEFSHALIRQTLYGEFSTARRLRLHRRIAETLVTLDRRDDETVSAIAHHYLAAAHAADPGDVAHWACQAARRATTRYAFEEALALVQTAVEITEGALEPDDEVHLLAAVAAANGRLIRPAAAAAALGSIETLIDQAGPPAIAAALVEVGRSLLSVSVLGVETGVLRRLSRAIDADYLPADLALALEVERAALNLDGDTSRRAMADRLTEMDTPTLSRALAVIVDVVPTRASLDRVRGRLADLDRRSLDPSVLTSLDLADLVASRMAWDDDRPAPDVPPTRWRTRSEGLLQVFPVVEAIQQGQLAASGERMDRLAAMIDPRFPEWRRRWAHYELDRPLDRPDAWLFGERSAASYQPHARPEEPTVEAIRQAIDAHPSITGLTTAVELVWEIGAVDLAAELLDRLQPATGVGIPIMGPQYVTAADYHLGLLLDLLDRPDEAIEKHAAALEQVRSIGYRLDEGHVALHLVRLLGRRNGRGDFERARAIATETTANLEPTELVRRRRELAEAVAALPS